MIKEITVKNCFAFNKRVSFDLSADMRLKRLSINVFDNISFNILKSAVIFGKNNTGKTCFIKVVDSIKNIMLNEEHHLQPNIFSKNSICELGIKFIDDDKMYSSFFKYDFQTKGFCYESFSELKKINSTVKEDVLLRRDSLNNSNDVCKDKTLLNALKLLGKNNLVVYQLDSSKFPIVNKIKNILQKAANNIEVVSLNNIPLKKTIDILKKKDDEQQKIVEFISQADLDLNNIYYEDLNKLRFYNDQGESVPNEKVLTSSENIQDKLRLFSVYKGKAVPSLLFDSSGTKKMTALSSYVVEALEEGKTLFVDELDSGIHFKLTRAIVAMFNNDANRDAQLVSTVHDVNLLDCKKLLRKEQIWFIDKKDDGVDMYSLAEFKAKEGTRSCSDIIDKYKRGLFNAIPEPNFINLLLSFQNLEDKAVNA